MDSYNKRQKEMRRLERQRDKAAKRKELKARKAAGITGTLEDTTEVSGDGPVESEDNHDIDSLPVSDRS